MYIMNNFIISIGRQLGSGGKEIAEKLGERLNIKVYDKTLLEVAAKESGLDTTVFETADEQEHTGFFSGLFSIHGSMGDYLTTSSCIENDKLFEIQSETIRGIAERENCIIVGRCAEYVLRDHPCRISVFIYADEGCRVRRIMERNGLTENKAIDQMNKVDHRRASYYNFYTGQKWGRYENYTLAVNSSALGIEDTARMIADFALTVRNRMEMEGK